MSRGDQLDTEKQFVKLLLVGESKAGKDYYAFEALKANFNIIMLDGDVGRQTLAAMPLTREEKHQAYIFPVNDRPDKGIMATFFAEAFNCMKMRKAMLWDETTQAILGRTAEIPQDRELWEFDLRKMTSRDVLVIDSWTAMAWSAALDYATATGLDLADMAQADQTFYQSVGNRLNKFLMVIQGLPCHIIVLAHPDVYEQLKKPKGGTIRDTKQKDMIIVNTKRIPKSISKPHGATMGKFFTDIMWITPVRDGTRKIDSRPPSPDNDTIVGGKWNAIGDSQKYSFAALVEKVGGELPKVKQDSPAVTIHPAGTYVRPEPKVPVKNLIQGGTKKPMALRIGKK